jgi:hypothetical protein
VAELAAAAVPRSPGPAAAAAEAACDSPARDRGQARAVWAGRRQNPPPVVTGDVGPETRWDGEHSPAPASRGVLGRSVSESPERADGHRARRQLPLGPGGRAAGVLTAREPTPRVAFRPGMSPEAL